MSEEQELLEEVRAIGPDAARQLRDLIRFARQESTTAGVADVLAETLFPLKNREARACVWQMAVALARTAREWGRALETGYSPQPIPPHHVGPDAVTLKWGEVEWQIPSTHINYHQACLAIYNMSWPEVARLAAEVQEGK